MILDNFAFIKDIDLRYCLGAIASVGSNGGQDKTTTKSVTPSAIEPALRRLKTHLGSFGAKMDLENVS